MGQASPVRNTSTPSEPRSGDAKGLALLLERIARTEGEINPNDRAVARIYAGYMTQQAGLRRRATDRR